MTSDLSFLIQGLVQESKREAFDRKQKAAATRLAKRARSPQAEPESLIASITDWAGEAFVFLVQEQHCLTCHQTERTSAGLFLQQRSRSSHATRLLRNSFTEDDLESLPRTIETHVSEIPLCYTCFLADSLARGSTRQLPLQFLPLSDDSDRLLQLFESAK